MIKNQIVSVRLLSRNPIEAPVNVVEEQVEPGELRDTAAQAPAAAAKSEHTLVSVIQGLSPEEHDINVKYMPFLLDHRPAVLKIDSVLECTTNGEPNAWQIGWNKTSLLNDQIEKSLKDALASLTKHIAALASAATRIETRKRKEADEKAVKEQANKLQKSAEAIKKAKEQAASDIPALFLIEMDARRGVACEKQEARGKGSLNTTEPHMLTAGERVTEWLVEKTVGKKLASWGAGYKKKPTFDATGKSQERLERGQGLELTQAFFGQVLQELTLSATLDISSVSKQFSSSYWLFGLRSTFHSVATTPNSCAMIMVLAVGQLEHFFFEAVSTTKALQEMGLPKTNITEVASSLQGLKTDAFMDLLVKKAAVKWCLQSAEEMVYIPTGWLHAYRVAGGPVTHGVRKSFFLKSDPKGEASYVLLKELQSQAGTDVSKMDQIEALFGEPKSDKKVAGAGGASCSSTPQVAMAVPVT